MFNMKKSLVNGLGKISAKKGLAIGVTALSVLGIAGAKNQNKVSANSNNINSNHTLNSNNIQPAQNKLVKDNATVNQLEQKPEVQTNNNQHNDQGQSKQPDQKINNQTNQLYNHILSGAVSHKTETYSPESKVTGMKALRATTRHHKRYHYVKRNGMTYKVRNHKHNRGYVRLHKNLRKHSHKISRRAYRRHYQLKHRKHHSNTRRIRHRAKKMHSHIVGHYIHSPHGITDTNSQTAVPRGAKQFFKNGLYGIFPSDVNKPYKKGDPDSDLVSDPASSWPMRRDFNGSDDGIDDEIINSDKMDTAIERNHINGYLNEYGISRQDLRVYDLHHGGLHAGCPSSKIGKLIAKHPFNYNYIIHLPNSYHTDPWGV